MYGRSTYGGIRAAINRHIRSPPHNRTLNLMSADFHHSNQVFKATLKKLCVDGLDRTTHHHPISMADLTKLRHSDAMSTENQYTLQKKVWFDLTINFARRGCENINSLKKDAYVFKTDDTGREYVEMKYNEKLKNHQGVENTENLDSKPRMYTSTQDTKSCPVKSLKLYLSKLHPENDLLFQQPRQKIEKQETIWYTTRPVGSKTISGFMAQLSSEAGLSQRYTNHCVRATTITMLSHAGVSSRAITRISKHRNETSLKHYERDSSDQQKRDFANIILQESSNSENTTENESSIQTDINNQPLEIMNIYKPAAPHTPAGNRSVEIPQITENYPNLNHRIDTPSNPQSMMVASTTNVMSRFQFPQLQNPYSFSNCSVTVENNYHYN